MTNQNSGPIDFFEHSILIVDDLPNNLKLLSSFLADLNYEISVARSGEQALEQLKYAIPDLIILDVIMPGIDGFETCRRIKANATTKDIPVIFMTALAGTSDMVQGFEAGGIDYITKPIQQAEALARIDVQLRNSKLTKQLQNTNHTLLEEVNLRRTAENKLLENQKRLEELVDELAKARDLAQQANHAKSAFLASMSHELRTPLNAILGYAQILQKRPLDAETIGNIGIIEESGEHLLALINDSLDVAKIEAGKMELVPEWIHFPSFLKSIVNIIQSRTNSKNLTLNFEIAENLPSGIKADETRLRQVLLNILGNAVKFTDEGVITFRVQKGSKTAVYPDYQSLCFEITDTGIGLAKEDISRIFEPYEQVGSQTARHKGAGLGLTISQKILDLMDGTLQVTSMPGKGSTFSIEAAFPISEKAIKRTRVTKNNIPIGYAGPKRSVLIVDDIASNRLVLKAMLRPLGLKTVEAQNGQQALNLTESEQPDIILMDRWMPEMDGLTAITKIRNKENFKDIPIIAVSASIGKEDKAQFKEAGASDFLPKPIALPNLIQMLQKHLQLDWQYKEKNSTKAN